MIYSIGKRGGYWKTERLVQLFVIYNVKCHLLITIGSRMAKANNIIKDFKAAPILGKDSLYVNWKKEIKIWEAFASVSEEKCAPAIFMTLTREAREAILNMDIEKSHTCEEGGTQLRISFWHLLMNLKNKYLLKKLLQWANKKQNNFNIYNSAIFLNNKEKHLAISFFYTCVPKILMIWSRVPEI